MNVPGFVAPATGVRAPQVSTQTIPLSDNRHTKRLGLPIWHRRLNTRTPGGSDLLGGGMSQFFCFALSVVGRFPPLLYQVRSKRRSSTKNTRNPLGHALLFATMSKVWQTIIFVVLPFEPLRTKSFVIVHHPFVVHDIKNNPQVAGWSICQDKANTPNNEPKRVQMEEIHPPGTAYIVREPT